MNTSSTPRRRPPAVVHGTLTIGKHKGQSLADADPSFLTWLLDQHWLDPKSRRQVEGFLAVDVSEDGPADRDTDPDTASAAVRFPLIVFLWQQEMRQRYAGRPVELAAVEDGLGLLKQLCTEHATRRPWLPEST